MPDPKDVRELLEDLGGPERVAVKTGMGCPDCGEELYYAEGCLLCRVCGYNKCE